MPTRHIVKERAKGAEAPLESLKRFCKINENEYNNELANGNKI